MPKAAVDEDGDLRSRKGHIGLSPGLCQYGMIHTVSQPHGVDASPDMVEGACKRGLDASVADAHALSFDRRCCIL